MPCTETDFLAAWRSLPNAAEVGRKLGMTATGARSRARWLRAKGYKLRKFKTGRPRTDRKKRTR